jgi:hypothetical protein
MMGVRLVFLLGVASRSAALCPGVGAFPAACDNFTVFPTGNGAATLSALSVQGETQADDEREFLVNLGLVSSRGNMSQPTPFHDKVTLYAGVVGAAGTGDIWSVNTLVTQEPGSGEYNAQGIELDFNNENAHRGDADAGAGLAPPVSYGLSITGAAPYRSTAAMLVTGSSNMWNRGIVLANDCVVQSSFQDLGSPEKSVDIRGNPTYGIYQSSPATTNYFAGKTGVGAMPPGGRDASDGIALHVGGGVRVEGRVVRSLPGGNDSSHEHSAVFSPGERERVLLAGNVALDETGCATVLAASHPGIADALDHASTSFTYQLTALGAAMPSLHVIEEVASIAAGLRFSIGGGAPRGRVSWQLMALMKQ